MGGEDGVQTVVEGRVAVAVAEEHVAEGFVLGDEGLASFTFRRFWHSFRAANTLSDDWASWGGSRSRPKMIRGL
ncbi:hypothetical protein ABT282_28905, partial [Streptomyces sp. NPDC000927]|uniref:hypothetical protein n=1 Tax=Streptomyces sp. NPDC000927 TaxID=3154371 RepID=UPI00332FBAFF